VSVRYAMTFKLRSAGMFTPYVTAVEAKRNPGDCNRLWAAHSSHSAARLLWTLRLSRMAGRRRQL